MVFVWHVDNVHSQYSCNFNMEEKLMNKQSEQLGELFSALSKAQSKIKGAVKDAKNPYFKSNYATLHECWNAIREPLSENGLTIIQTIEEENGKLYLRSVLGHSSGQFISSLMPILMAKADPQALGSATSYSRRYSLCALIGLSQMDDDGESAMTHYRQKPPITKEDEEYVNQSERVDSKPLEMNVPTFMTIVLKDEVATVGEMTEYLDHLVVKNNTAIPKIMERAINPKYTKTFVNGFKEWYSSKHGSNP